MANASPNIVMIVTDQQRRSDIGCYGNSVVQTPHIDALARAGTVFDNAFTANCICMPSRASIHTGRMPRSHGLVTNGCWLSPDETTLPQVLAANGYRTAHVGKCHLAPFSPLFMKAAGTDPARLSPEGPEFWSEPREFPLPYYGYQQALVCSGHGRDHMHYYHELLARDPALPELLKREQALVPPSGAPSSWKSAIPEEHHCSTWVGDHAVRRIEEFAAASDPFFLFVGIPDPHFPYCPPAPWCDLFDPAAVPMPRRAPDEPQYASADYARRLAKFDNAWPYHPLDMPDAHIREIIAHSYGMVALLDKTVGRVSAALQQLDLADNTIVVFTTDHGEHLGDHWLVYKCSPYDELIHLPLIWSGPTHLIPRTRTEAMVSHIDLMPTVLDLADIPHPRGIQGTSYAAGLCQGEMAGRPYVMLEDDEEDGRGYTRTLRTSEFRLTYYLPDDDGELFDLRRDPNEFVNVWKDPDYRETRADLIAELLRATITACDPKPEQFAMT